MKKYIELNPSTVLSNLLYAEFLNALPEDYEGAERHAKRALELGDSPRARYQWAAARYQRLLSKSKGMSEAAIVSASYEIYKVTNISLDDALSAKVYSTLISTNLETLRAQIKSKDLPWLKKAPSSAPSTVL